MSEKTAEEVEAIKKSGLFFIGLDKLVRGIKLYEGQGSLVEQLLKDGYAKAKEVFSQEYTYKITPVGPMFLSEPLSEEGKNPDYLFQMYCDAAETEQTWDYIDLQGQEQGPHTTLEMRSWHRGGHFDSATKVQDSGLKR